MSIILLYISFLLCYAVTAQYDYHMFQLNSYKMLVHIKWAKKNFIRYYASRHVLLLINLAAVFTKQYVIIAIVVFLTQALLNLPKKAKKPLVYTKRVIRMLFTNAVLIIAFMAAAYFSLSSVCVLTIVAAATPVFVLLSNVINKPVEASINNWYINDAKKILNGNANLIVIGVTGSYGKTSTKYFLHKLLSQRYNVLMTPENYNTTLGVVKTIRMMLKPIHEIFICEMGARGTGQIKEICDIVKPRYGIITSIGPQHLETFITIQNIINTKFELADALPENGAAFLNYDNEHIKNREQKGTTVSYSVNKGGGDYFADEISVSPLGSKFVLTLPDKTTHMFETKLIGTHNVQNIVGCIAVAHFLGVSIGELNVAVRRLESVPHRLQLINRGGVTIIDDAYNSNQTGAKAALEVLSMFEGVKILATPGMIELGEKQDEYNFEFGVQASRVCDYVILVGKKQTEKILEGLKSTNYNDNKIFIAETIESAFSVIYSIPAMNKEKIVLLENDLPDNY